MASISSVDSVEIRHVKLLPVVLDPHIAVHLYPHCSTAEAACFKCTWAGSSRKFKYLDTWAHVEWLGFLVLGFFHVQSRPMWPFRDWPNELWAFFLFFSVTLAFKKNGSVSLEDLLINNCTRKCIWKIFRRFIEYRYYEKTTRFSFFWHKNKYSNMISKAFNKSLNITLLVQSWR